MAVINLFGVHLKAAYLMRFWYFHMYALPFTTGEWEDEEGRGRGRGKEREGEEEEMRRRRRGGGRGGRNKKWSESVCR